MGGKAIKKWSDQDKAWLRSRFVVDADTAQVFLKTDTGFRGDEIVPCRVGPGRKQYLAVSAKIAGKWTKVRLHILVWFFVTDQQSMKMIDHKEGCPTLQINNRFSNLRQATDKQNCANKAAKGYRQYTRADGSQWYYALISWRDRSTGKVKTKRSKLVQTPEQAREIYLQWKKQRFGQFCFEGAVEISVKGEVSVSKLMTKEQVAEVVKTTRSVAKRSFEETDQRLNNQGLKDFIDLAVKLAGEESDEFLQRGCIHGKSEG